MANLDHLPAQCKPGHQPIAAAVMECFVSSRVVVHECRVLMLPGRPTSKAGLDCRVMHARGVLTGEQLRQLHRPKFQVCKQEHMYPLLSTQLPVSSRVCT